MRKTVYWIEGDGIGPDVWKSARPVIDEAIRLSYGDERGFDWKELLAGEKALKETGIAQGRIFDRALLEKAEQELKRQYLSRGRYDVKATDPDN